MFIAACGDGSTVDGSGSASTVTTTAPVAKADPGVYFVAGEQFVEVKRGGLDSSSDLRSLLGELIAGPDQAEKDLDYWSDIPEGTKVVEAAVSDDGRTAEISLGPEFDESAGRTEGTREERLYSRLGQVVFTATSLPGIDRVILSVPGTDPLTLSRSDFSRPAGVREEPDAAAAAADLADQAPAEPVEQVVTKPPPAKPKPQPGMDAAEVTRRLADLGYLPASGTSNSDFRTRHAVIAFQGWEGLDRDGVVGPKTAARLRQASRPAPASGGSGRSVEIHRAKGVLLLIEDGRTVRALHTSTGAGGDSPETGTPTGSFRIYRKEARSWSVPFKTWLPYAAYWNAGWAMHEYPDVPNYPASHGCARLPAPEAPVAFGFVSIGTPVRVY